MPTPKGPVPPPVELDLSDEDEESTQVASLDFVPGEAAPPAQGGGISLDDEDDDEDRTTIEKRPGPSH